MKNLTDFRKTVETRCRSAPEEKKIIKRDHTTTVRGKRGIDVHIV